jgi:hypothetical protein
MTSKLIVQPPVSSASVRSEIHFVKNIGAPFEVSSIG